GTNNYALGQGRIEYAIGAVFIVQALGGAENTTTLAHILTKDKDTLILRHHFIDASADRFEQRHCSHQISSALGCYAIDVIVQGVGFGRWCMLGVIGSIIDQMADLLL